MKTYIKVLLIIVFFIFSWWFISLGTYEKDFDSGFIWGTLTAVSTWIFWRILKEIPENNREKWRPIKGNRGDRIDLR